MESLLPFHWGQIWQRIYIQAGYRVGVRELMGGGENRFGIVGKDITSFTFRHKGLICPSTPFASKKCCFLEQICQKSYYFKTLSSRK